jgi:hypothetical protein
MSKIEIREDNVRIEAIDRLERFGDSLDGVDTNSRCREHFANHCSGEVFILNKEYSN